MVCVTGTGVQGLIMSSYQQGQQSYAWYQCQCGPHHYMQPAFLHSMHMLMLALLCHPPAHRHVSWSKTL